MPRLTCVLIVLVTAGAASPAAGQPFNISGGYSVGHYDKSDTLPTLGERVPVGWFVSIAARAHERWAIVADIGGEYATTEVAGRRVRQEAFLFLDGPRLVISGARASLFGEVLLGVVHDRGFLNNESGNNHFATQPGIGVDVRLTDRIAARFQGGARFVKSDDRTPTGLQFLSGIVVSPAKSLQERRRDEARRKQKLAADEARASQQLAERRAKQALEEQRRKDQQAPDERRRQEASKISVADPRWTEECITATGAPQVSFSPDNRVITFILQGWSADAQPQAGQGAVRSSRSCRLSFDLRVPAGFRASFVAAQYSIAIATAGDGQVEAQIRHVIKGLWMDWSKRLVVRQQKQPGAAVLTVTEPPRSGRGGTRRLVVDIEVRARAPGPDHFANVEVTALDLDAGLSQSIALQQC